MNLALRLRDFTAALATGRLVLLLGEEPGRLLEKFFAAHPGYNLVTETVAWPG